MLESLSSYELSEWRVYYELEPFGEERADFRSGIVASTVAETHRNHKKRKKPYTAKEFMPTFSQPAKKEQSPEEQLSVIEALNLAFGGKDLRQ